MHEKKINLGKKILNSIIAFAFFTNVLFPNMGFAQVLNLPVPGTFVPLTSAFTPPLLKGIQIHPDNPLQFDFIVHGGDQGLQGQDLKPQAETLIRYFLASLTVPEDDLWVNLSPYEQDRIMEETLSMTELGRDLLAQDYILKQITSSLLYPEDDLGKKFWDTVYKKSFSKFGTTEIPIDTFHKIWIVPNKAVIYENGNAAFVAEATLKVMLEQDYLALEQVNDFSSSTNSKDNRPSAMSHELSSEVLREIVIPAIEREVNHGEHFAPLRQIYHSVVLSAWFKQTLRESLVARIYADQKKVKGIEIEERDVKQAIYQQYLKAFQVGVYNYIKVEYDAHTNRNIPRKYFSGGSHLKVTPKRVKDLVQVYNPREIFELPEKGTSFGVALKSPSSAVDSAMTTSRKSPIPDSEGWTAQTAINWLFEKYKLPEDSGITITNHGKKVVVHGQASTFHA